MSFRFGWGNLAMSKWITLFATYWATWVMTAWGAYELASWLKPRLLPWIREHKTAIATITLCCVMIHTSEPHFHKVLSDEPAHAAVALSMHLHRTIAMPYIMHFSFDVPTWEACEVPFRGHYFSFLVSLLHDLCGFRQQNAYVVNGIIGFITLITLYAIGHGITGRKDIALATSISLASAPIFGQVMCSGSYDLCNLSLLALLIYFVLKISQSPSASRKDLRIALITSVLLSYARPESIIYYGIAVVIIVYTQHSNRQNSIRTIHAEQIAGPLLFIPALCTQIILTANPYNLTQGHLDEGRPLVSLQNLSEHWWDTAVYFVNATDMNMTNVLLFISGIIASALLLVRLPNALASRHTKNKTANLYFTFSLLAFAILGLYSMIMSSFWGGATLPIMTRFTLPLWLLLCLTIHLAISITTQERRYTWLKWSPIAAFAYFMAFTIPSHARGESIKSMELGYANHKALTWIAANDDKRTLYVGNSAVQFIARNHPAVSMTVLKSNISTYVQLIKSGIIGRIVLLEYQFINPRDGKSIIHERPWRDTADQWKYRQLWSYQHSIGMQMVMEELEGVTIDGKFYDFKISEKQLPTANTIHQMQQKTFGALPSHK